VFIELRYHGRDMKQTPRTYTKVRRAVAEEATRERIVSAIMELHEEIGPARTTVSAVAERAGVERLTVYRHFPDDRSMFQACSSRWIELNRDVLIKYWDGDIEFTEDAIADLRPIDPGE